MEFYERYYRKNGLWGKMTKGMVDIEEYHKTKEYQALSSKEKVIMDKEIEEMNRVIESQIVFFPYGDKNKEMVSQNTDKYIEFINECIDKVKIRRWGQLRCSTTILR